MPTAEEAISNYQSALKRDSAARKAFDQIYETVHLLSSKFHTWNISNLVVAGGETSIHSQKNRDTYVFDSQLWPTGESIASAIAEMQSSNANVKDAWIAIPEDCRVGLHPPSFR